MNIQIYKWVNDEDEEYGHFFQFIFVHNQKTLFGLRFDGILGDDKMVDDTAGTVDTIVNNEDEMWELIA